MSDVFTTAGLDAGSDRNQEIDAVAGQLLDR